MTGKAMAVGQRRSMDKLILDLNSSVSETYGRRERQSYPAGKPGSSSALLGQNAE